MAASNIKKMKPMKIVLPVTCPCLVRQNGQVALYLGIEALQLMHCFVVMNYYLQIKQELENDSISVVIYFEANAGHEPPGHKGQHKTKPGLFPVGSRWRCYKWFYTSFIGLIF
jgi:hypothetical protein